MVILEQAYTPPSRRRGGRDLKRMLRSILCGADGVVVSSYRLQIPRGFDKRWLETTTPSLAIKNNRSRLPLLARRGNLLADTSSAGLFGQAPSRRGVDGAKRVSPIGRSNKVWLFQATTYPPERAGHSH